MRPRHTLAQAIGLHGESLLRHHPQQATVLRTLRAIMECRTSALGGHVDACTDCGTVRMSYNSCRNRHCPQCQGREREAWVQQRSEQLPGEGCFHVVFTLPAQLNALCIGHPKEMYDALFAAAWQTVTGMARNPAHLGAQAGMIAVLHTWGQQLTLHPHVHCIIPDGGVSLRGRWKSARGKGRYLFPVKAMASVFRAKFMAQITNVVPMDAAVRKQLFAQSWVVFAKAPMGNTRQIVEYLGRYTHRTAISNHRLVAVDNQNVTFQYKDYRQEGKSSLLTLTGVEFLRRFCLHILPKGYRRIRHYGILSNRTKHIYLNLEKKPALDDSSSLGKQGQEELGHKVCPCCGTPTMVTVQLIAPLRGPPSTLAIQTIGHYASTN
jgi:hypothetical protein